MRQKIKADVTSIALLKLVLRREIGFANENPLKDVTLNIHRLAYHSPATPSSLDFEMTTITERQAKSARSVCHSKSVSWKETSPVETFHHDGNSSSLEGHQCGNGVEISELDFRERINDE